MEKKSVLLLNSSFYPSIGGVENSLRSLAECLSEDGIDVFVVASDKGPNKSRLPREESIFGAKVIRYRYLPFFLHFLSSFLLLFKLKKKYNFDYIISRSHITTLIALILGLNNVKYIAPGVYRFQNKSLSDNFLDKIRYHLNTKLEEIVFRNIDAVYVFSDNMVSQIKKLNSDVDIIKISPGIDVKRFSNFKSTKEENEIVTNDSDILLLFLGRVEKVKQPCKAIECLTYLPSNYKLLFVGEGRELDSCKKLVKDLNLTERVIFRNFTDSPETYYSSADIFLMPSSYEPFGQVILEALASRLPIVAFDSVKTKVDTATNELLRTIDVENAFVLADKNTSLSLANACLSVRDLTDNDINKVNHELVKNWSWLDVFKRIEKLHSGNPVNRF